LDLQHSSAFEFVEYRDVQMQRAVLGRMCKRLIDRGRLEFLLSIGFCAEIVHYCSEEISPENALLVAWLHPKGEPAGGPNPAKGGL
jgi:tRNA:m4X modification enzyme